MKKYFLLITVVLCLCSVSAYTQEPNLTVKKDLPVSLHGAETFNDAANVDTIMIPFTHTSDFTVEVKGKVSSAIGRGLDIEARKKDGYGYRTSVTPSFIYWSNPLSQTTSIGFSSTEEQVLRYAVKSDSVHIYQNGVYVISKKLESVKDIVNDTEVAPEGISYGDNQVAGWAGTAGNNSGYPTDYGWAATAAAPWNTANSGSGVRYIDRTGLSLNGNTWDGRILYVRWDAAALYSQFYSYKIEGLQANTVYKFSFLYMLWSNASTGTMRVGFSKENTGSNLLAYSDFYRESMSQTNMYNGEVTFTTDDAGTYYLIIGDAGDTRALWAIADLSLVQFELSPRILIGKNYQNGAVDMEISSVSYDNTGAFAPEAGTTVANITITDETVELSTITNKNITVSGNSNLHVTGTNPLINSTINLTSDNSWLYLEAIKPSKVSSDWLTYIKINGQAFNSENDRIAIYGSGSVIIPNGKSAAQQAITVYTEENYGGESRTFAINVYNKNLGTFDNNIKSFKLKRGFSATLANNSDGTGYSRVFIASDADVEVPVLPEGMENFVSFVRVFKWEWTSKKGWAGAVGSNALNEAGPTIFYDWDAAGNSENTDTEYVPMRHNLNWQSFDVINSRNNVSHVLGYNEPERSDQSNMTVEQAIIQWPNLFKSGLRIGSPAPSSTPHSWLNEFMNIADSLNYRVDFVATHAYQNQNSAWWEWMISATSTNANGRPVWVTEWNNGANWTTESWPTASGPQRDADLNIILDGSGNETTINMPLSPENAARQVEKLKEVLPALDNIDKLEHHFLYNWVQDARAIELSGKLTPAGKYFASFKSEVGFKKSNEYIHTWKIAPPWVTQSLSSDSKYIKLSWYDHNGETGKSYVLERKLNGEANYVVIATFVAGEDYQYAGTVQYTERIAYDVTKYRVKAISYKDTESIYSRVINVTGDSYPGTPVLTGEAVSSTSLKIEWEPAVNARSYNVKRSGTIDGTYEAIAENYSESTAYIDVNLARNTSYFYKVSSVNNSGEGVDSQPLELKTKDLQVPSAVVDMYASSGDGAAILTWEFAYDTQYKILRATDSSSAYSIIKDDFDGFRYVDKSGITNGTTYYYKIIGKNDLGEGPVSNVYQATPQQGQHLKLTFNEESGGKVYDEWGGYHGTLNNNAQRIATDNGGGVVLSETDKSYIQLESGVVSDLSDFTIASWFKTPNKTGNRRFFDFGNGTETFMFFVPRINATQARYKITSNNSDASKSFTANITFDMPDNEWFHIAMSQEGKVFKLYIDGELIYTGDNANDVKPLDLGITTANYLGYSQFTTVPYSDNGYDDFRIYNYALSANDVVKLFNHEELHETVNIDNLFMNGASSKVYPAMLSANDLLNVELTIDEKTLNNTVIEIVDVSGKKILSCKAEGLHTAIAPPGSKGLYIVIVRMDNFSEQHKIIVK